MSSGVAYTHNTHTGARGDICGLATQAVLAAGGILHSEDALSSQIILMKTIWNVFIKFVWGVGEGEEELKK